MLLLPPSFVRLVVAHARLIPLADIRQVCNGHRCFVVFT